jgi:hypothetical protein
VKTLLDDKLKAIVSNTVKLYGQALASYGWSDLNSRPLLNVMSITPKGQQFLYSIDTSEGRRGRKFYALSKHFPLVV